MRLPRSNSSTLALSPRSSTPLSPRAAEFATAFDNVDKHKAGRIAVADVEAAFRLVFHGELPALEKSRVQALFSSLGVDSVSRDEFLGAVLQLQQDEGHAEMDLSKSAHYHSYSMLRDHKKREVRPEAAPQEIYSKPLTLLGEVGWRATERPVGFVRFPRKACEETKFAGELFKAGVI